MNCPHDIVKQQERHITAISEYSYIQRFSFFQKCYSQRQFLRTSTLEECNRVKYIGHFNCSNLTKLNAKNTMYTELNSPPFTDKQEHQKDPSICNRIRRNIASKWQRTDE